MNLKKQSKFLGIAGAVIPVGKYKTFTQKMAEAKKNLRKAVTKPKRRNASPEYDLQVALVTRFELTYPGLRFCASAGGMRTTKRTAIKMKRSGYRKGFPDLFFYEPRKGYNGFAMELKAEKGKASKEQKEWIADLSARGYFATICRDFDDAKTTIQHYFLD